MASDVRDSGVCDSFISANVSHMLRLCCMAGNWKYCRLILSYTFLPLVYSSASNSVDLGCIFTLYERQFDGLVSHEDTIDSKSVVI